MPELIQKQTTPERLSEAVLDYFQQPQRCAALRQRFSVIHESLRQDASHSAAASILELVDQDSVPAV